MNVEPLGDEEIRRASTDQPLPSKCDDLFVKLPTKLSLDIGIADTGAPTPAPAPAPASTAFLRAVLRRKSCQSAVDNTDETADSLSPSENVAPRSMTATT